jgi:hypothetical protein
MKYFWLVLSALCGALAVFNFKIGANGMGIAMILCSGINIWNYHMRSKKTNS